MIEKAGQRYEILDWPGPQREIEYARQEIETQIAATPDYARYFARLRETFTADYETALEGFAARYAKTRERQSVDYYLAETMRQMRQTHGLLAAKADKDPLTKSLKDAGIVLHLSEVKGPVMDRLRATEFLAQLRGKVFLSHFQAIEELAPELLFGSVPSAQSP